MPLCNPERQLTRQGYLLDDGFTVDTDVESDVALAYVRTLLRCTERRRRANGAEYERQAKRQRVERVARGLPADEDDNDSYSLTSDSEDDDSDWEPEGEEEEEEEQ